MAFRLPESIKNQGTVPTIQMRLDSSKKSGTNDKTGFMRTSRWFGADNSANAAFGCSVRGLEWLAKVKHAMKTIWTLGHPSKRKSFDYEGTSSTGVTLIHQAGKPYIDAALFTAALNTFKGKEVKGGFKEDDPPRGGFGEWVQETSRDKALSSTALTPRHASFIAAILCEESGVQSRLEGKSVWLRFPD
jgi:hypothetical protein